MVAVKELVDYCDELLRVNDFKDYCPNGLQVEGTPWVRKIVAGVTASQSLIDMAIEKGADVLLVHHGFFWKNEAPEITGIKYRRVAGLIKNGINLIAYHLPLDAHPQLGNNAQLGRLLEISVAGRFGCRAGDELAMYGRLVSPRSAEDLAVLIEKKLHKAPLHIAGKGSDIKMVGWCTGAAQSYIEAAADLGLDAYISGEISESTTHMARELGIHYFAAGHHATERYGVQALGDHLCEVFGLSCEFIDVDNPV